MKLFIIPGLIMLGCSSVKLNQSVTSVDSTIVAEKTITDSLDKLSGNNTDLPTCIKNKIDSFKVREEQERPQRVVEYTYKGKKVYYVVMHCCDFYNEVYDSNCNLIGAPDGGFTGRGDGKLPDFFKEAKDEKLIWKVTK